MQYFHEDIMNHEGEESLEEQMEAEHHASHQQLLIVLFVFLGLLLGGICREINKNTKFPFTPLLVIVGLCLGHWREYLGVIGESTEVVRWINPHLLLLIFIPVLIFESAFNCDWYVFKKAIFNIVLLAAPGVLFGAFMLGACIKVILGYDELSWPGALMMGSILGATDPVAVVALLKELGASVKFNTLIEGESLLNDGTAMVFYQLFLTMVIGESTTPAKVVISFCRLAGGGPILGICIGILSSLWLRRIIRDDVLTCTITFIACYICFYLAEFSFLGVSGILSIVSLGLFMSAFGKSKIYAESEHAIHVVWGFAQYGCETLIFLLTGILIGIEMIEKSTITGEDWIKMLIFWILMMIVRFIMVFTFSPLLRRTGYGLETSEMIVLCYGGLRGALGLTLSLMVGVDLRVDTRLRELTVFYMSGMACLSLLINGTTCGYLVAYLGMIKVPETKAKIANTNKKRLFLETQNMIEKVKADKTLSLVDWNDVTTAIQLEDLFKSASDPNSRDSDLAAKNTMQHYENLDSKAINTEARFRSLTVMKGLIWEEFEEGQCSDKAAHQLEDSIKICLDKTEEPLSMFNEVYLGFTGQKSMKFWYGLKDWPCCGGLARGYVVQHLSLIYEMCTILVKISNKTKDYLPTFPIPKKLTKETVTEFETNIKQAQDYLNTLSNDFSEIIQAIQTKRATNMVLNLQKHFVKKQFKAGYMDELTYQALRKTFDRKLIQLEVKAPDFSKLVDLNQFVIKMPIFRQLTVNQQNNDLKKEASKTYTAGTIIVDPNSDSASYIYFVEKGCLEEVIPGNDGGTVFSRTVGSLVGVSNLLHPENNPYTEIKVKTDGTQLIKINANSIKALMSANEKFARDVYCDATYLLTLLHSEQRGKFSLEESHMNQFTRKCDFRKEEKGSSVRFTNGGYIFEGEVKSKIEDDQLSSNTMIRYKDFAYIPPQGNQALEVERSGYMFQFNKTLDSENKDHLKISQYELETEEKFQQHVDQKEGDN